MSDVAVCINNKRLYGCSSNPHDVIKISKIHWNEITKYDYYSHRLPDLGGTGMVDVVVVSFDPVRKTL